MSIDISEVVDKGQNIDKFLHSFLTLNADDAQIVDLMARFARIQRKGFPIGRAGEKAASAGRIENMAGALERYYINNLLWAPRTQVIAALGNSFRAVDVLATKGVAEVMGAFTPMNPAQGATYAHFKGMMQGIVEGWSNSKEFIRNGTVDLGGAQFVFDASPTLTADQVGSILSGKAPEEFGKGMANFVHTIGRVLDPLGKLHAGATKMLQTQDVFFRTVAKRAHENSLVHNEVLAMGFRPGSDAYKRNYLDIADDLRKGGGRYLHVEAEVNKLATSDVFMAPFSDTPLVGTSMDRNLGVGLQGIDTAVKKSLPLVSVLSPFMRVAANIAERTVEKLPVVNMLNPKVRADFAAGGTRRLEVLARTAMGYGALAVSGYLGYEGHITGSQQHTRRMRKALVGDSRFQENTIVIGDTMYKYDRLDPYGTILGIGADIGEMVAYVRTNEDEAAMGELALAASVLVGHAFFPEFIRDSIPDILELVNNPEDVKRSPISSTGLVPFGALLRDIRKEVDPLKRDTKIPIEDINSAWTRLRSEFAAHIPGLSDDLPPVLNIFGEEIAYPNGVTVDLISPFYTNKVNPADKKLYDELMKLGMHSPVLKPEVKPGDASMVNLAMPSRIFNTLEGVSVQKGEIGKFELNPEQYHQLVKFTADGLKESLSKAINSEGWSRKPIAFQKMTIGKIIRTHQKAGRLRFMKELPGFSDRRREDINRLSKELRIKGE